STTALTRERSASPEYVGGVSTHTNRSRACSTTGASSDSKCRRWEFLATSSDRPGSKIGTLPLRKSAIRCSSISRHQTSWPSSAKQAALTSPTQPTPMTPIGGGPPVLMRSAYRRERRGLERLACEREGPSDSQHLAL